jgi:hypothetical protein
MTIIICTSNHQYKSTKMSWISYNETHRCHKLIRVPMKERRFWESFVISTTSNTNRWVSMIKEWLRLSWISHWGKASKGNLWISNQETQLIKSKDKESIPIDLQSSQRLRNLERTLISLLTSMYRYSMGSLKVS